MASKSCRRRKRMRAYWGSRHRLGTLREIQCVVSVSRLSGSFCAESSSFASRFAARLANHSIGHGCRCGSDDNERNLALVATRPALVPAKPKTPKVHSDHRQQTSRTSSSRAAITRHAFSVVAGPVLGQVWRMVEVSEPLEATFVFLLFVAELFLKQVTHPCAGDANMCTAKLRPRDTYEMSAFTLT